MGQLGGLSPQGSIVLGIFVGLLSTCIQSLGLTLQRKSHLIEDAKTELETRRPPYRRGRWQLGMSMFVAANLIGSSVQIATLPLPVLATLQAAGLVFNTAFATILLKEPFTRYSFFGTLLTCAGAALIATFGAIGESAHTLSELLRLFGKRDFIIWMTGTLLVAAVAVVLSYLLKVWASHKHIHTKYLSKSERPRSNSSTSNVSFKTTLTAQLPRPLQIRVSRLRFARGLSYGLISGILAAHSLLMAKSAVELLVRTIVDHNNQFNRFQSWLILLALIFFALSQLYYLHLGLRLCSTSVLYPFVFCIYNIIAILDGLIYFQQGSRLTTLHACLVALGTLILLGGVLALSWRLDDTHPDDVDPSLVQPNTSLTPGMGFAHTGEGETSPLLPTSQRRRLSDGDYAPIKTRLSHSRTYGGTGTAEIWAELEDEDTDDLPIRFKKRPRVTSAPLPAIRSRSQGHRSNGRIAPGAAEDEEGSAAESSQAQTAKATVKGRGRGATRGSVRFADEPDYKSSSLSSSLGKVSKWLTGAGKTGKRKDEDPEQDSGD